MPFDVERYQMLRRSTALGVRVRHREVTESTMDAATFFDTASSALIMSPPPSTVVCSVSRAR